MAELSSKELAALKSNAQDLKPALQVGKAGLSPGVVEEVRQALEREPLLKIKLLKAALEEADRRDVATRLAEAVGATLVEVRGFTVVLYRAPKRGGRPRAR